jgi:wyosine [tRNA(Phe)-imidazoG37] synthetase (radical SAM superfamily)
MSDKEFRYVFGPVPSRRLGRSLGIDLVPFKTCTYDCIYCQLGRTTHKTVERKEYAPVDDVMDELKRKLDEGHPLDYVTLSGSGEPTLFSKLGQLLSRIKGMTETPLAVLSNGSLFWQEDIRLSLADADLVIPSLDVGNGDLFRLVNRPHQGISFDQMVDGLIQFRHDFTGLLWLEVLLLEGITAFDSEVAEIVEIVDKINPDRVHVNTAVRPPSEEFAHPVLRQELVYFAAAFGEKGEAVGGFRAADLRDLHPAASSDILALLKRRPCSLQDVARGLGIHPNEAIKYLTCLMNNGTIAGGVKGRSFFYWATPGKRDKPLVPATSRKETNRT